MSNTKAIFAILLVLAAFQWHQYHKNDNGYFTGAQHDQLIMYSLTTCGLCVQKKKELMAKKIPFVEYYIDKDPDKKRELWQKLEESGFTSRRIGTPTFDAYGHILPNNPSIETILNLRVKSSQSQAQ